MIGFNGRGRPSAWHVVVCGLSLTCLAVGDDPKGKKKEELPQPRVVAPGKNPGDPPADAVMLFDGKSTNNWRKPNGQFVGWTVKDGELLCKPGSGSIVTTQKYMDVQMHVEFWTPLMPKAKSQGRGNSGVYLQGRYEVQVLDSFQNETYPNGSCGAVYLQHTPLVNACRPPEQWQTYDIVFHSPRVDDKGKITRDGSLTIIHNGVLIQDHVKMGPLTGGSLDDKVGTPGPLMLQDHGNNVKFRNIWIRPLG